MRTAGRKGVEVSYPCLESSINLPRIATLASLGVNVGFSDHTQGIAASLASLSYNVSCIERHFTTDHDLPGRDNKFAILPHQLKDLSDYIKIREEMFTYQDDVQQAELDSRKHYTGRFNG